MLSGEYAHNIDAKGRITIPAKFREQLGENFVITKGLDNCLFVYSKDEWEKFESKLSNLSMMSKDARSLTRFFVGSAVDASYDKMGRALLSPALKEYASLDKETVLVGVIDRIEIWNKETWDKQNSNITENMEDIANRLDEIGLSL